MPRSPKPQGEQPQDQNQVEAHPSKEALNRFFAAYDATWREGAASELVIQRTAATSKPITFSESILWREEAEEALCDRRRALLKAAGSEALNRLYWRLAGDMGLDARKADARLIEIAEEMKRRNHEAARVWDEDRQEREAAALRILESVGGSMPLLPAALADVLRWASGVSSDFPWDPLETAFVNLLSVLSAKEHHKTITYPGGSDAVAWVLRYETALASPGLPADQRAAHEAELLKYIEAVNQERALADVAERFKPQMPIPKRIEREGENTFARYWKDAEVDQKNIVFFAEQFRPFWLEHGSAYIALYEESRQEAEARAEDARKAGKASGEKRAETRWKKFTQDFCDWSSGREITDGLIESYPKQHGVIRDKGVAFLKTLLNATRHAGLRDDLVNLLKVEGIDLPETVACLIASECTAMLGRCISAKP